MPKYKVVYTYLTRGVVWVESKNKKEASVDFFKEDFDQEDVVKYYKPKITLE